MVIGVINFKIGKQSGIGLIELMIAMTLSLFIGAAVIQVFISQRQTYQAQDDMARLQENARFAFEQIASDLRQVGYWGCSRKAQIFNNTNNPNYSTINDLAVTEANGKLSLFFLNPKSIGKVGSAIDFDNISKPRVVADCTNATIFDADIVPSGYPNSSLVYTMSNVEYSVNNGGLFRGTDNLIDSGVEGLDMRYGVAGGTGWAASYKDSGGVGTNWSSVVSVEVTLKLRGEIVGEQEFKSVIAIRNRLP